MYATWPKQAVTTARAARSAPPSCRSNRWSTWTSRAGIAAAQSLRLPRPPANLFVIFGEPDITILHAEDGKVRVKLNGVGVFHPQTGEVRSDGPDGVACGFIDTDYNEESFFVRHAYFLGANDPYSTLKTNLKTEINEEAWATLNSENFARFSPNQSPVVLP